MGKKVAAKNELTLSHSEDLPRKVGGTRFVFDTVAFRHQHILTIKQHKPKG